MDEIYPEMLKALVVVGLYWLTGNMDVRVSAYGLADQFNGGCAPVVWASSTSL